MAGTWIAVSVLMFFIFILLFPHSFAGFHWCNEMRALMLDEDWVESIRSSQIRNGCKYSLSDFERANIYSYTGDGSADYNLALKNGGNDFFLMKPCIDSFNDSLQKLPIYSGVVWRGVKFSPDSEKIHQEGSIVSYPSFTSTTKNVKKVFKLTHSLKIISHRGKDLSKCSEAPDEEEIIFSPETKFKVLQKIGNQIMLEEI